MVPPETRWSFIWGPSLRKQAGRCLDGSLAFPENPHYGLGGGEALAEAEADADGEADGDGLADGVGFGVVTGAWAWAELPGSGGGGGVAMEITTIKAIATRPRATGMASVSAPRPGRTPVLCAEVR